MKIILCIIALLQVCNAIRCPSSTGTAKIPNLDPKRFSYKLQINVEDLRKTLDGYEFYDHENETISMYIDQEKGKNNTLDRKALTYDYKYNQTFTEDEITGSCTVQPLNTTLPHQVTLFGYGVEEGPQNVQYSFYWNGSYKATHQGYKNIDGIDAQHYNTCLEFGNEAWIYEIDVYFSLPNWTMPAGQNAPIMLKLNATNETTGSHMYTFKFSDYHTSDIPLESRPHKPSGKICSGRKDAPEMPLLPDQYQHNVETRVNGAVIQSDEFYDYTNKFIKVDVVTANSSTTEIHDFNQGISYQMNHNNGRCVIAPIPFSSHFDDAILISNSSLVRMRSVAEYYKQGNFTFGGFTVYQGVPAQIWIAQKPYKSPDVIFGNKSMWMYSTMYFSYNVNGSKSTLLGFKEKLQPMINSTTNVILNSYVYNFKESVSMDVFDISSCYGNDMKATVIIKFSSEFIPQIVKNQQQFDQSCLKLAAQHANIPPVRVKITHQSLNAASPDNAQNGGIYIWLTLLGLPNVTGDAVNMTSKLNLTMALTNLKTAVANGDFVVVLDNSLKFAAIGDYWMTEEDLMVPHVAPTPGPSPPSPASSGMSSGAVAGIAIAMLVVGFLIGVALLKFKGRHRRAQYGYGSIEA